MEDRQELTAAIMEAMKKMGVERLRLLLITALEFTK